MNDNSNDSRRSKAPWYVMCHLNPRQIEVLLRKECEGLFGKDGGERPSPFRFYIPFLYMPVAEDAEQAEYTNELRGDFHNFVFIQATASRVADIVTSEWNTKARLHLYYYRDHEGNSVVVQDEEVQRLMDTFRDQTLRFFIGQPVGEFAAGDSVILNMPAWAGQRGVIKEIRLRKGKLAMTISLNIFNSTKSINFTDLQTGDIAFEDPEKERLFSDNPVDRLEEEVVDILSHRVGHAAAAEVAQADATRLKRLSTIDKMYMEQDDADHARFLALRLITAVLRQDRRKKDSLQKEVERLLASTESPATADEAYLTTALFVATRQARYRDAVKAYRQAHPDSPDILRRYHSIVKKMKAKAG